MFDFSNYSTISKNMIFKLALRKMKDDIGFIAIMCE